MAPKAMGGLYYTRILSLRIGSAKDVLHTGVVGSDLKIYGLANVRVVDASVIPLTIGAPLQPTVYAVAENVRKFHAIILPCSTEYKPVRLPL